MVDSKEYYLEDRYLIGELLWVEFPKDQY